MFVKRPARRRFPLALTLAAAAVTGGTTALLAGPKGGDLAQQQQPKWKIDKIPDAPPLSPADELETFRLPPGFRAEAVAKTRKATADRGDQQWTAAELQKAK